MTSAYPERQLTLRIPDRTARYRAGGTRRAQGCLGSARHAGLFVAAVGRLGWKNASRPPLKRRPAREHRGCGLLAEELGEVADRQGLGVDRQGHGRLLALGHVIEGLAELAEVA